MHRKILFFIKEALKVLTANVKTSWTYFLELSFLLFIMIYSYIILININYYHDVFTVIPINNTITTMSFKLNIARCILFILVSVQFLLLVFINNEHFKKIIDSYLEEIKLVEKMNCDRKMYRMPVFYQVFFINACSIFFIYIISTKFYSLLCNRLKYGNFSPLKFQYFNGFLFLALTFSVILTVFITGNYRFYVTAQESGVRS